MWEYTDKVKELFLNAKNAGVIEDASGVGEVGSMACHPVQPELLQHRGGDRSSPATSSRSGSTGSTWSTTSGR